MKKEKKTPPPKVYKRDVIKYYFTADKNDGIDGWFKAEIMAKYIDGTVQMKFKDGYMVNSLEGKQYNPPKEGEEDSNRDGAFGDWYLYQIKRIPKIHDECHNEVDPFSQEEFKKIYDDAIIKFKIGNNIYCYDVRQLYKWINTTTNPREPFTNNLFTPEQLVDIAKKHEKWNRGY